MVALIRNADLVQVVVVPLSGVASVASIRVKREELQALPQCVVSAALAATLAEIG
jgi:hypothetical protein